MRPTPKTDLVHHVIIASLHLRDRPAGGLLDGHHVLERLLVVHEVHRDTLPAKPARTSCCASSQLLREEASPGMFRTYPVDVRFNIRNEIHPIVNPRLLLPLAHHRQVVVHHHVHLRDIDTTGNDVRGDQHLVLTVAEAVHDGVTIRRFLRTVK